MSHIGDHMRENPLCQSPLHCATASGNLSKMKECLRKGTPINLEDMSGSTALHVAVKTTKLDFDQRFQICKYLIDHGANIEIEDQFKCTPLSYARRIIKQERFLNMMISRRWNFVKLKNTRPSLFRAVKQNDLVAAKRFLQCGANPNNTKDCTETITILSQAVKNDNVEMIELLLSHNACVQDSDAISLAIFTGKSSILQLLLENGADMRYTLAQVARRALEIVDLLLAPNRSNPPRSPNHIGVLQLLIENGFPISNPHFSKVCRGERVACCFVSSAYNIYSKIDPDCFTAENLSKYPAVKKWLLVLIRQVAILTEIDQQLLNEYTLDIIKSNKYTRDKFEKSVRQIRKMKEKKVTVRSNTTYFNLLIAKDKSLVNHCSEEVVQVFSKSKYKKLFPDYAKRLERNVRRGSLERTDRNNFKQMLYEILKMKLPFDLICYISDMLKMSDFRVYALRKNMAYYRNLSLTTSKK